MQRIHHFETRLTTIQVVAGRSPSQSLVTAQKHVAECGNTFTISILGSPLLHELVPGFRPNVGPKHGYPTPLFWYITKVTVVEIPIYNLAGLHFDCINYVCFYLVFCYNNNNMRKTTRGQGNMVPTKSISKYNLVHHLQGRSLLIAINCLASLSIFFFGYDQGMMGGVNNAVDYYQNTMKIGHQGPDGAPVIDNPLLQGGIVRCNTMCKSCSRSNTTQVSVYYLGTLSSAFIGGWFSDHYGRINTIALGAAWAVFGACLQCSAQNHIWMIFARLINGWGTGLLNVVVPVYSTETAAPTNRGLFVAVEFTLNIFGVVVAYWLEYGCSFYDDGRSGFTWRFPIAFQILPLLFLLAICKFFPESPRWLAKVGRMDEAKYVLDRLRGETEKGKNQAEAEYSDIVKMAERERSASEETSYFYMFFDWKSKLHLGRRVQLVIWLQIVQEWVGIAGVCVFRSFLEPDFKLTHYTTGHSLCSYHFQNCRH